MIKKVKQLLFDLVLDTSFASGMLLYNKILYSLERMKPVNSHIYYHRHSIDLPNPLISPLETMKIFQGDLSSLFNDSILKIKKIKGKESQLISGDEFIFSLPGGWVTPLRLMDCAPRSITFITLDKNFQSGAIHLKIEEKSHGQWKFIIESLAQSIDVISLHAENMPLAKFDASNAWVECCHSFAKACQISNLNNYNHLTVNEAINDTTKQWQRYE